MWIPIILTIILLVAFLISIMALITKRKKARITGFKSALTPICFYLIVITNVLAYWFGWLGIISWLMTIILLILAAYFTKYLLVA
ncbi:hypothetical protein [Salirhabdus sp. Marseille-P4669]|uniref:hypothetical protein n=1 Tax=Salirhabdus sp. Marseille-P4669 TaxID=2042310 RepID=UPI000C7DF1BF|nr:hypothetical protein [Salirhabdus sp. Marseille-P4669]